jgi:hypothetical protein
MKERIFKSFLLGWAIVHLALVSVGASYGQLADWLPCRNIINFYTQASGANSSYGFFAPSIGMKVQGLFDLIYEDGSKLTHVPLITDTEREMHIRLGGIFDELTNTDNENTHLRQSLAASLCAAMFTKYHEIVEVILHVQEFLPVSIAEYREGKRQLWVDYYKARFARAKQEEGKDAEKN